MTSTSIFRAYSGKIFYAIVTLLLLTQLSIFLYETQPSFLGFDYSWDVENRLYVSYVHPPRQDILEYGDVIEEFNGIQPIRGEFSAPRVSDEYIFEIVRDAEVQTINYKPIEAHQRVFVDVYVSVIFWIIGVAIIFVSDSSKWAFVVSGTFVGWAINWLGVLATDSAIGWITNVLIFPFMPILISMSGLYFDRPLNNGKKKLISLGILASSLIAVANLFEVFALFPSNQNIEQILGFRLEYVILFMVGISLIFVLVSLIRQYRVTPPSFKKQSITIVFLFSLVGLLPFVILVVLPLVFGGGPWVNPAVCFVLMSLIPLGFLCAMWRERSVGFETNIARIALATMLSIILLLFLLTIQRVYLFGEQSMWRSVAPATTLGVLVALYPRTPLLRVVDRLIYGHDKVSPQHIQTLTNNLRVRPAWDTVEDILSGLIINLDLNGLAIYLRNGAEFSLTATTSEQVPNEIEIEHKSLMRKANVRFEKLPNSRRAGYIPLVFSERINGVLFVDYSSLRQIDARTISILIEISNLLSISIPAITVQTSVDNEQAASLYSREIERREIADRVHDGPLQSLIYLKANGDANLDLLQEVIDDLRGICTELHNPILNFGAIAIVDTVVEEAENKFGMAINVERNFVGTPQVNEQGSMAIYHVTTEALHNVRRHAQSRKVDVSVSLDEKNSRVIVMIMDDGVGFSVDQYLSNQNYKNLGLRNMARWARLADGELTIVSKPNNIKGTKIQLAVPVNIQIA